MSNRTAAEATANGSAETFAAAHAKLRADPAFQFDIEMVRPPGPSGPSWFDGLFDFLDASGPVMKILFWAVLALAALALLAAIARRVQGGGWSWRRRTAPEPAREDWRPEEAPARALLQEADALAAAGRYDEAAHLLLFRSIEDIDRRRPDLVRPALTSRDIAVAPALPSAPKRAFGEIVMMVERSLFGGRTLGKGDWQACRAAYQDFAFASAWKD